MIKAIVFTSNTGYTEKYARMLSSETKLPAYPAKEAAKHLKKGDEIIYMGWLCAGSVKGYSKAARRYRVRAVCAVGMQSTTEQATQNAAKRCRMPEDSVFCLQGGYDKEKLSGIYKLVMNSFTKAVGNSLEKKTDRTDEEDLALELMRNGGDCVSLENLSYILAWYRGN